MDKYRPCLSIIAMFTSDSQHPPRSRHAVYLGVVVYLLQSAMAGRLYKLHSKHTSNSGFDQTFMACSGYILFAAEQRVEYQISWVNLQREVNCP